MLKTGNTGLQQATAGNTATSTRGCWRLWQHWAIAGNCWQHSNIHERMLETSNTGLQQATAGSTATSTRGWWRLATLGYSRQLLAAQQHPREYAGDSGNTGLQQATAGNSETPRTRYRRLWQLWATTGNSTRNVINILIDIHALWFLYEGIAKTRIESLMWIIYGHIDP